MLSFAKKAYRYLHRLISSSASYEVYPQVVEIDNLGGVALKFELHSRTELVRTVQFGGEKEVLEIFLKTLKPSDIVFDVGASVGLYAIAGAVRLSKGALWAFEPDPETHSRLRINTELNDLDNVYLVDWAASDKTSMATLYTDGTSGFAPALRQQDREGAPTGTVAVETRAIDDAIEVGDLPRPDVVKIDIEGAESLCLRGCSRLVSGAFGPPPRVLLVEVHPKFLPDFGATVEEVYDLVESTGYEIAWRQDREDQEHLLCVHSL